MLYTEYFTLRDCSGFLQIRSHIFCVSLIEYFPFSYSSSLSSSTSSTSGASENASMQFSVIVLASWDHSLVSSEAVSNLSKGINNTLKVITLISSSKCLNLSLTTQDRITEYQNAEKKKIQTNKEKAGIILRRVAAWMFAALLVILATGGIVVTIVFGPDIRGVSNCFIIVFMP